MRLIGITMLRNEADIVEAFVRHNLSVLDALVLIDHASATERSRSWKRFARRAPGTIVSRCT
jgi:hypothetical protein